MSDNSWGNLEDTAKESTPVAEVEKEVVDITAEEARTMEVDKLQEEAAALHENTCPKCFWDTREKVLKACSADLEEYTRCIIGGRPFKKKIEIFGGRLVVGFLENTDAIRDEVMRLMKTVAISSETTTMEIGLISRKIQVLYSLTHLTNGDAKVDFKLPEVGVYKTAEEAAQEYQERFANRSSSSRGILFRAWQEFDRLIVVLSDGAFDENFYKGVGLA